MVSYCSGLLQLPCLCIIIFSDNMSEKGIIHSLVTPSTFVIFLVNFWARQFIYLSNFINTKLCVCVHARMLVSLFTFLSLYFAGFFICLYGFSKRTCYNMIRQISMVLNFILAVAAVWKKPRCYINLCHVCISLKHQRDIPIL